MLLTYYTVGIVSFTMMIGAIYKLKSLYAFAICSHMGN